MKRLISVMLTLVMSLSVFMSLGTTAAAGLFTGTETGKMQDTSSEGNGTVYWEFSYNTLQNTATLRLSGDGYMPNGTDESWLLVQQQKQCYITELIIENGVKSIMEDAFYGEEMLESVTLPESIEFIGDAAFADTAITTVTLPKNLESFNGTIFNSQSFKEYKVHPENPYFTAVDGVVYSKDLKKLVAYPIGKNSNGGDNTFIIPDSVTEIGAYAFLNCQHASFTIPGTAKSIGMQAFAGNTNLSSVNIINGVENIYDGAFLACNSLKSIHLPASVKYIGYCSLAFIYDFDFDGLSMLLDQKGIEHETITADNAAYYALLTGYSSDAFVYCAVDDNAKIYAPTNSAGHKYCNMFGVTYRSSQAITPKLISAKQTSSGVEIQWTLSSDADGYYIYRKNKSGSYKKIATVSGKNKTSYTDKKAYSSYKNTYTVKAYNSKGVSRYFTKGISAYYIPTPELSSAQNTASGIKVSWEKVSTATNYNIYRKKKGESSWEHIGAVKKSKLYFTDTGVSNKQTYYYTVRAYDNNSVSEYDKNGVGTKCVSAPKISSVKNTSKGVSVSWKKVSGATSYRVYRKTKNGRWELIKKVSNATSAYTDTTAKSGITYTYAVKAVNKPTVSGYNYKTIEYLKKPVISSANSTKTGITVNYSKTSGADKYYIYRKLNGEDAWTRIATVSGSATVSYKDKTAEKGKTYRYTVRAVSGSYKSAYDKTGYKIKDKY